MTLGRLFWKFFAAFATASLIAGASVGIVLSILHDQQRPPHPGQPPPFGEPRPPSHPLGTRPPSDAAGPPFEHAVPPPMGPPSMPLGPPPRRWPPPPVMSLIAALVAGLTASAVLAWYFSKPVRQLRWALGEIADGRLTTRVEPLMGGRRDEIADLGHDVDAMAAKLTQLVDAQRRLLHDVSHELRSPLARMQAAVGLARQDAAKSATTFDRLDREAARLNDLIDQLLTISRLDAGSGSGKAVTIDVVELLASVAEDAGFEAANNGREVAFVSDVTFIVAGWPELLHRAFENVLRNAIKFTAAGTCVEIAARCSTDDRLLISVCDHGPGVPDAELASIFEPFHRCVGGRNKVPGFGLGLAITKRAIEAHGGFIHARNRSEGGLCMEIELPRR